MCFFPFGHSCPLYSIRSNLTVSMGENITPAKGIRHGTRKNNGATGLFSRWMMSMMSDK